LERLIGAAPAIGVESGQVSVKVEGGRALPDIIRAFEDRSIELAEFGLRRASLNAAFLALSGNRAEDETVAEEGKAEKADPGFAQELDRIPPCPRPRFLPPSPP